MKVINYQSYTDFILAQDKTLKILALNVYPKSSTDLYNALINDIIFDEIFDYFSDYKINPNVVIVNDRKKCFVTHIGY